MVPETKPNNCKGDSEIVMLILFQYITVAFLNVSSYLLIKKIYHCCNIPIPIPLYIVQQYLIAILNFVLIATRLDCAWD